MKAQRLLYFLLFIGLAAASQAAPVRIMPLGDSITGGPGCWRAILWNRLQTSGCTNIDFVGTLGGQTCPQAYDMDGEGHSSTLVTDTANNNLLPGWLSSTNPDIVMMMYATNDLWNGIAPATILTAWSKLVDQMRANNPNMKIIVAQITPLNPTSSPCAPCPQRVIDFNALVPAWAAGKTTAQSPIVVVDQWTGYNTATDTGDGVHPNAAGNQKISDKYYPALAAAIGCGAATSTPTRTLTRTPTRTSTRTASPTATRTATRTSTPSAGLGFARGADVGWLTQMESQGRLFYDEAGTQKPCLQILQEHCIDTIRLRVWVNPAGGWCGKADVINQAVRAKNMGFRIMIDFHYSDSWADPGQQNKPAAWAGHNIAQLRADVAAHTTDVLTGIQAAGVTPEWVQVGNETNDGMLWEEGRASANMANFASLVDSGYGAVKGVFPSAKVIVHISNGFDNALFRWIFDGLRNNGARWDVCGMSLYPDQTNWTTLNNQCLTNMNDMVSRYNKDVMVVEVGMDVAQPQPSHDFVVDIINKTQSVSGGRGLGVIWWEPEAYNWMGYNKVTFTTNGRPTTALSAFGTGCSAQTGATSTPTRTSTRTPTRTNTPAALTSTQTRTATRTNTPLPATHTATRTQTASASRTATPSATPSPTLTATPSYTASRTASPTRTNTLFPATATSTPTRTNTLAPSTSTSTPSRTTTASLTSTRTITSTNSPVANTPTTTSTSSRTLTLTRTASPTLTMTVTSTSTRTPTPSSSQTATPSTTSSPTSTNTGQPTNTSTDTPVASTLTSTSTRTPSRTATASPTSTNTGQPTNTLTSTPSPSNSATSTSTAVPTSSRTASPTATDTIQATATPSATSTASTTSTSSPTLIATNTHTSTAVPPTSTRTMTPTITPTFTGTLPPTPSATQTPTWTSSPTQTLTLTRTQTSSATPSRTSTASRTMTMISTSTATPSTTVTVSSTPTVTLTASVTPTASPTPSVTLTRTSTPRAGSIPILSSNPANGDPISVLPQNFTGLSPVTIQIFTDKPMLVQMKSYGTIPLGWLTLELTDSQGQPLAGGLYYVRVTTKDGWATAKLLILR